MSRTVIKLGGSILIDATLRGRLLAQIGELHRAGQELIMVHGGGKQIAALLAKLDGKQHKGGSERLRGANHDLVEQLVLFVTPACRRQRPRDFFERTVDGLRDGVRRLILIGDLGDAQSAAEVPRGSPQLGMR